MTHHVQGIIQAWQASYAAQSSSRPFRDMKEPPNVLVLAVNLQALPLKDLTAFVETASEDEIKAHKGLRSSFVIAEVLFAGFTFIAKGDNPKNKQQGAGSIERLGVFDGEDKTSMLFYTWKGERAPMQHHSHNHNSSSNYWSWSSITADSYYLNIDTNSH